MSSGSRSSFFIILMATSSPVSLLVALMTDPNAPLEVRQKTNFGLLSDNLVQVVSILDVAGLETNHVSIFYVFFTKFFVKKKILRHSVKIGKLGEKDGIC